MDLTALFKTSADTRVEGPVLNVDHLVNQSRNFIQKKIGRKNICPSLDYNFSFCMFFLHVEDS